MSPRTYPRLAPSNRDGKPTKHILHFARQQPGGVVRWSEALSIYWQHAQGHATGLFGKALSKVFKRHFTKVEGVRGFYVLDSMMDGELV